MSDIARSQWDAAREEAALAGVWEKITGLAALLGVDKPGGRPAPEVLDLITDRVRALIAGPGVYRWGSYFAPVWRTRSGTETVQAIRLTAANAHLVIAWLASRGVRAIWDGPPMRLSFDGPRGSYCLPAGDWVAFYTSGPRPGAESWLDEDWQETWERDGPRGEMASG